MRARLPDVRRPAIRVPGWWSRLSRRLPDLPGRRDRGLPGWRIVAAKEFADNLLSIRFYILLALLSLAGIVAVLGAAGNLRDAANDASRAASPFLLLYTLPADQIPSFTALIGFLGPLLGIAFGFDAVNNERAQRTLPRLVAQPIHRDDIVNGKFAAGLGLIALTFTVLVALMAGLGILRLGVTPSAEDLARLLLYLVVTTAYVGVWLGFALLCSVALPRAATSALVAFSVWIVLTIFGTLIIGLLANLLTGDATTLEEALSDYQLTRVLSWLSPETLYSEATAVLMNPEIRTTSGFLLPEQVDRAIPGELSLDQSLLVIWPQFTALVAACVVVFAVAYVLFLRQEVRA